LETRTGAAAKARTPLLSPSLHLSFSPLVLSLPSLTSSHLPSSAAAGSPEARQPKIPGAHAVGALRVVPFSRHRVVPPIPGGGGDLRRRGGWSSWGHPLQTASHLPSPAAAGSLEARQPKLPGVGPPGTWNWRSSAIPRVSACPLLGSCCCCSGPSPHFMLPDCAYSVSCLELLVSSSLSSPLMI
jgi:hypothetical protein